MKVRVSRVTGGTGERLSTAERKDNQMKVEIKDGQIIITLPMQTPTPSASGKTLVVASSQGNKATDVQVDGKPVIVGVNAYIRR